MGYDGNGFHGIRSDHRWRAKVGETRKPDIISTLKKGLGQFNNKQHLVLTDTIRTASRTDVGVHASRNAFTVDVCQNYNNFETKLPVSVNSFNYRQKLPLYIEKVYKLTDDNFDCRRWATRRDYTYRIIQVKNKS